MDGRSAPKRTHSARGRKIGGGRRGAANERFDAKCRRLPSGCLEWQGAVTSRGYGAFFDGAKIVLAHRFAFERAKGPIPPGLTVDHGCTNKLCQEPTCLEAVTQAENTRRWAVTITECVKGHSLTDGNMFLKAGKRQCRECTRERGRRSDAKRRRASGAPIRSGAPVYARLPTTPAEVQ